MEQFGKLLAKLRKENNMTQAELGEKLNVTYQAVSKWENDQSLPDFHTIVEIAKLFNVPLSTFANEDEVVADKVESEEPTVGFCKTCGIAVKKENLAQERPFVLCKHCAEEEAAQKAEKQKRLDKVKKEEAESKRKAIKRGFLWAAILTAVVFGLELIFMNKILEAIKSPVWIFISPLFLFPFVAQLFWDGCIVEMCLLGGRIVAMPGIIFSWDVKGILWLIAIKILFAIIKLSIFVFTYLIVVAVAILISPFTFLPALERVRGEATLTK